MKTYFARGGYARLHLRIPLPPVVVAPHSRVAQKVVAKLKTAMLHRDNDSSATSLRRLNSRGTAPAVDTDDDVVRRFNIPMPKS